MTYNEKAAFCSLKTEKTHTGTFRGERYAKFGADSDKIRDRQKKSRQSCVDYRKRVNKLYRQKHYDRLVENKKAWNRLNKKHVTDYNRNYANSRRKVDVNFRLRMNLRNRLRLAIKENNKSDGLTTLIGCSVQELIHYLEGKFKTGMNWENYGSYWVVDHILPCASFDLSKQKEQRKCFNYTNLQPLTVSENLSKGCRILS